MSKRFSLLLVSVSVFVCSCGPYDWPPFADRMTTFFDDHRDTLDTLEQEMAADGYRRMNTAILSGSLSYPATVELAPGHAAKYGSLLRRDDFVMSVHRQAFATEFEFLSEPVGSSLYLFRIVHGVAGDALSECDGDMRLDPCGTCAIDLARHWQLEYEWFPQDVDAEARLCR